jgi:hypothetical protein
MAEDLFTHIFRGAVLGWEGGTRARSYPATYTTKNPAKAVLFAIAFSKFGKSVVLICPTAVLKEIDDISPNRLAHLDEEQIFMIKPADFEDLSQYITISEAQSALLEIGIDARMPARDDNVYDLCKKLPVLTNEQIEKFVSLIKSQLKKV